MQLPGAPGSTAYQAAIEGLKAVANLILVNEETFRLIVRSHDHPTIVEGKAGSLWFKKRIYLTSYDGFLFVLKAGRPLEFADDAPGAFFIRAEEINLPFL